MKLAICYKKDGTINYVKSFDSYASKGLSEEVLLTKIKETNETAGYEAWKSIEVTGDVEEVMLLLLGEKQYKRSKDIEDILDSLEDVNDTISNVARDIFDASEAAEASKKLVEKLKEDMEKFMKKQ